MAFIVVYDANVLYPNTLRDLLIRISRVGLVQAKWTNEILDETLRALRRNRPDIPPDKLDRLRQLMNEAVRDCLVFRVRTPHRRTQAPGSSRPARAGSGDQGRCSGHRHQQSEAFPGR